MENELSDVDQLVFSLEGDMDETEVVVSYMCACLFLFSYKSQNKWTEEYNLIYSEIHL